LEEIEQRSEETIFRHGPNGRAAKESTGISLSGEQCQNGTKAQFSLQAFVIVAIRWEKKRKISKRHNLRFSVAKEERETTRINRERSRCTSSTSDPPFIGGSYMKGRKKNLCERRGSTGPDEEEKRYAEE